MQRMQRKVGTFLPRTAGDAQVNLLINEFAEADRMLTTLIDASKAWRDAWSDILMRQAAMLAEIEGIYKPIAVPDSSMQAHTPADTPPDLMERTSTLKETYVELRQDMVEELQMVESRIVRPAKDAKDSIQFMKKVIKKRDDKKLDFERYSGRCEALRAKTKRTDRENSALQKHETDLEKATADYDVADDRLRSTLPGIVNAAFSLLPHLLNAQILVQNALLGHLYTALHTFCQDYGFESPPPEIIAILNAFNQAFTPLRKELETGLNIIAGGKAVQQSKAKGDSKGSKSGLNIRNGFSRKSSAPATQPQPQRSPALSRASSHSSLPPPVDVATKPKIGNAVSRTASNNLIVPSFQGHASGGASPSMVAYGDYFGRVPSSSPIDRVQSASSTGTMHTPASSGASTPTGLAAMAAAKKKAPPPPPKKAGLQPPGEFVVAQYDYDGGEGELSFREGDRIRVLKRTKSNIDWWEGELKGTQGDFPANYCK